MWFSKLLLFICLGVVHGTGWAFELTDLDEKKVNLHDFTGDGRWTLVMFWATDCIPCEQQKPMIEAFHREHEKNKAHVVGVALDGIEKVNELRSIIKKNNTSYPNLVVYTDVYNEQFKHETGKEIRATPTYILYKPDGSYAGASTGPVTPQQLDSIVSTNLSGN